MIQILTEEQVPEFVKTGKTVIKGWGDKCGFCERYAPIFEAVANSTPEVKFGEIKIDIHPPKNGEQYVPSKFKRSYMVQDKGNQVKETIPVTILLENGEMKARHFGTMDEESLREFIATGRPPQSKATKPQAQTLMELKAAAYDLIGMLENGRRQLDAINQQIAQMSQQARQ